MTKNEFQKATGVSRETLERLDVYAELLVKWQARINLVGPSTLPDLWERHFLDSAQMHRLLPPAATSLADIGSGAGFPGLVLAIMGGPQVHLIESDARKCAFLREAARVTGTEVKIHNQRIEQMPNLGVDVVTARALAPVERLLSYAQGLMSEGGECLFLKGRGAEDELTAATKEWNMTIERVQSLTDPTGVILRLRNIRLA